MAIGGPQGSKSSRWTSTHQSRQRAPAGRVGLRPGRGKGSSPLVSMEMDTASYSPTRPKAPTPPSPPKQREPSAFKIFLITRQDLGLVFVAAAGPPASGALELPALGSHVGSVGREKRVRVCPRQSRGQGARVTDRADRAGSQAEKFLSSSHRAVQGHGGRVTPSRLLGKLGRARG